MKKLGLILACAMLAFLPLNAEGQFEEQNPWLGKAAPDFTLNSLTGEKMSLTQFRGSDPVIIYFWATWCPHCVTEFKVLEQLQGTLKERGIKVLLVNIEETPEQIKEFLEKFDIAGGVVIDERSEVADKYGVYGFPTMFYIDKDGKVVVMEHGFSAILKTIPAQS